MSYLIPALNSYLVKFEHKQTNVAVFVDTLINNSDVNESEAIALAKETAKKVLKVENPKFVSCKKVNTGSEKSLVFYTFNKKPRAAQKP